MIRPARRSAVILGTALLLAPLPALACRDGRAEMSDPARYCAPWSVHDGDTPRAITPIGTCERLRLRDCNAPELDAPGGPAVRDRLARWLAQGARIEFALRRDGRLKRGRYCRPLVIVRLDGRSFCETVQ